MDIKEVLLTVFIVILFVLMLYYYSKCKRRISKVLFGFCSGAIALFPVQLLLGAMGATLSINIFTVSVSVVLGVPGVVLLGILAFV